jgi:DNA-binding CsgD family transcriptional regulator
MNNTYIQICSADNPLFLSGMIQSYCNKLFKSSGIKSFGYIELLATGDYIHVESNRHIYEDLIKTELAENMSTHILTEAPRLGHYMPLITKYSNNTIHSIKSKYSLGNDLGFIDYVDENDKNSIRVRHFYFASDINNSAINAFYLNHLSQLKRFCYDFVLKFEKSLNSLKKIKLKDNEKQSFKRSLNDFLKVNNILQQEFELFDYTDLPFNLKANNFLSNKEKQIVYLFYNQFTFKEIGEKLEISKRTVDRHLDSLRKKLHCKTTGHIIPALIEHEKAIF